VRPHITALRLFGSRARGDHRTYSDYDVLVVVRRKSAALVDALYESVLQVLLTHGRLVSLKVFEEQEFARLERLGTPFTRRIAAEGQPLG
jgi:predicted nucleotidyltransferase